MNSSIHLYCAAAAVVVGAIVVGLSLSINELRGSMGSQHLLMLILVVAVVVDDVWFACMHACMFMHLLCL